jgi:SEC-C motif-containing protein
MPNTTTCPCGGAQSYESCCKPYLERGKLPATAEALMRSRYSAFALGNSSYLMNTWHPTTAPAKLDLAVSPVWCGLDILATEGGSPEDTKSMVEFKAHYLEQGRMGTLHEMSRFVKENGRWFYVGGDIKETPPDSRKVGRNDPCPCGSNRKYKKCCGQ